ncbi:S-layer homology domain-containing protein [Gordoniibacillus kamchatkensis]|uniref:S-layer homology domain-containing protein n=1 Tax=Gordoniibacillus kamchatkensis TaxID=1590651 RepID=UPI0006977276|nr:S-layer homology domain-containing protein [Paenibacillus sp. VKM B-2647]
MNHRRMKKLLASTLALSLVMGMGTTAFAKGDDKKDDDVKIDFNWNKGKHLGQLKMDFRDIQGRQFEWAMRYIADLAARRVFEGYDDGTFRPQQTVSRIEAITAAVRVMGLRDKAESAAEMQTQLNFKDANQIPAWAVGYVAVALENDLFSEYETKVNPNQPADRLWATTLLVKALKLQSEAEANMNAKLPFADAAQIPAGSVGYVKVAIDKGLINGFEDNTFRPNQPVTRAEIAALLDRAGDHLPGSQDGLIVGTVSAPVTNNTLTVTSNGQTASLALDPNAFIYRAGARVSASALQVGDAVRVRVYNNTVIFVEVTQTSGGSTPVPTPANGVITGTVAVAVTGNALTLTSGGQTMALPLSSGALFFRNGAQISASGLQVGDVVSTRAYNNAVVFVEVTQPAGSTGTQPSYERVLSGTVTTAASNNVLTISSGGQTYALTLNSGAFVYRGGAAVSVSALQVGDVVTTYSYNNSVAIVEVTQTAVQPSNTTGDISGTVIAPANNNLLAITSGGQPVRLTLNANAFVYRNGLTTAAALQAGDVITAHYVNGVVLYIEVTQLAGGSATQTGITQQSGTVVSVANNVLTLISGNQTVTLSLHPNAFIYRGGALVTAAALQAGDVITARLYNNIVVYGEVTQLSSGYSFTVSGTYNNVTLNNQGQIATISINQTNANGTVQTVVYNVSSSVTIVGTMANLVQNRPVVLQGNSQTVSKIIIQ